MAPQTEQVAQGDVLLTPAPTNTPRGQRVPAEGGLVVLAEGIGGHSHVIDGGKAELYELAEHSPTRRLLVVTGATRLIHAGVDPDHDPIDLAPGARFVDLQEQQIGTERSRVED